MNKFNPLLQKLISDTQEKLKNKQKIAVIFDLDSTLFDTTPRSQNIMFTIAKDAKVFAKHPHTSEIIGRGIIQEQDWGIAEAMKRHGIDDDKIISDVKKLWRSHFFSNQHLHHDLPYPGAVEFVNFIKNLTGKVFYLTGRDRSRMESGTLESLKKWGFPYLDSEIELHMKPHFSLQDHAFKTEVLQKMQKQYDDLILFENEPFIIEAVHREIPTLQIIFIDSVHSGRADTPTHLPTLKKSYF